MMGSFLLVLIEVQILIPLILNLPVLPYTLFELDEHYPGTRLYEVTDTTDPDFPEKHMAVSFRYRLLDDFLKEWQLRKKQLREGEITNEEYLEWKLNWPQTADGCGRYEPKKKWRKE